MAKLTEYLDFGDDAFTKADCVAIAELLSLIVALDESDRDYVLSQAIEDAEFRGNQ